MRYYDPSLGRWTQQDPVAGSLFDLNSGNRYTYAEDDPVNLVDPSGKFTCAGSLGILIGAVVITVVAGILTIGSAGALVGVLLTGILGIIEATDSYTTTCFGRPLL